MAYKETASERISLIKDKAAVDEACARDPNL
jgi:hypothetical protein